ncbi:MAG: hydrogenase nickel incorporation protein HypB [Planctomycetota bacterium]
MKINVVENVLKENDRIAKENRALLDRARIVALNITSAPGSGKTTLLEKTLVALGRDCRVAVLVGDLQTTRDAERLAVGAAEVTQINTGRGCHLTAAQVADGLKSLKLEDIRYLFIENVGNMVCPAGFDLGEHRRVAMLSTPEGDDKVAKYPTLFQAADLIILNKTDLIGTLDYDTGRVIDDLSKINTRAPLLQLSAKTGENMDLWLDWLRR